MRALTPISSKEEFALKIVQEQEIPSKKLSGWRKIWQSIVNSLISKSEMQVWSTSDRSGNTEWHAYEPKTGRSIHVASEAEMRHMIEQSYYH